MLFSFQLQILFPNVTPFSSSQSHSFYYGRKLQINVYSFVRYTFCSNFLMLFFIFLFFYQNFIIYHSTCLIIFIMQGFKGLLPRQTLTDQAFLPIYKKAQDHRKAAQMCIDFFQQINKFFQSFSVAVEKCIQDADIQNLKASYYCLIGFVCTKLLIENKNLTDNTKGSSKQLTKLCNVILQDFSKYLQAFQGNLRKYQESQNIVQELSKKYFRSHKNMLASIESYKASLTDVTLIYNVEEQIKRYQTCETNYKTVTSQFQAINEKSQGLTQKKLKIVKNYEDFKTQFTKVIKMIGSKVISETKNFVNYYCITNKNIATFLAEQKYNLQREQLRTFFSDLQDPSNPQHFDLQKIPQRNGKNNIPLIFLFPQLIKQQHIESYNSQVLFYLKKIQQNIESRKSQNKRILDLFSQYFKIIQRVHIIGVKEIIQNFDKLKKKLIESFGPRLASFMKSMNAIFQLLSGINEKLVKNINTKLISIQTMINEQGKLLKLFNDELRINIQKFIGKKQLKKLKQQQFTEQTSVINVQSFRKQVSQKVIFFKHLIEGFQQKMKKNCQKISQSYTSLVQDLNQSINQFYSLCCQYQQLYFGPEQFKKNFQIYETDVENLIQKNKGYFQELVLNILKGDNAKVIFDGEFHKVQDFKKLKKPAPVQVIVSKQPEPTEKKVQKQVQQQKVHKQHKQLFEQNKMIESSPPPKKIQQVQKVSTTMIDSNDKNNRKPSTKQPAVPTDEKQVKNYQFILSKVQFKENEQYIKSFACAFSSKIVLQGRIYITTHRICFSSGFNSNNIFFGSTFIQFPKQDIVKLEKKTNTLLMDNSISFTTVKGELFFTSFFSRNEAYDLICKTFELSLDQHVYQYNQQAEQEKPPQMVAQIKQDDDLNDTSIEGRKESIDPLLTKFPYNQFLKAEFVKQGLNAYQILKIFYLGNEISMNRRKFSSFLIYIRQILGHKDVEIDPWEPPLEQIMNQSNIKENSPLKSERKIRATVPVANSGVPFMPKTAKSQQTQSLYIYSKHKWVLETEVNTTGAPYTDTFKVQLRTTFTSDLSGNCEIVVGLFINFVKNTMMKSVIESKSQQQSMKASKLWVDEMKKYFTALSKSENTNISKKGQNPIQQIKQELETKNTEIQSLTKQKQELVKEITSLKIQKEKNKKILIGLVALVVFLFILLIT